MCSLRRTWPRHAHELVRGRRIGFEDLCVWIGWSDAGWALFQEVRSWHCSVETQVKSQDIPGCEYSSHFSTSLSFWAPYITLLTAASLTGGPGDEEGTPLGGLSIMVWYVLHQEMMEIWSAIQEYKGNLPARFTNWKMVNFCVTRILMSWRSTDLRYKDLLGFLSRSRSFYGF